MPRISEYEVEMKFIDRRESIGYTVSITIECGQDYFCHIMHVKKI